MALASFSGYAGRPPAGDATELPAGPGVLWGARDFPGLENGEEEVMAKNAVGFYWTLPVPWAGFTSLPADIDEAAEASLTIRFQRAAIRDYARTQGYRLIHEEVFMEIAPDRGSEIILGPLRKVEKLCQEHDAIMLYVDFGEVQGWRSHGPMQRWSSRTSIIAEPVFTGSTLLDGKEFNAYEHFRSWRERQEEWSNGKALRVTAAQARAQALKDQGVKNPAIAMHLNEENLRSPSGKPWTAESVRKFMAPSMSSLSAERPAAR